MFKSKQTAAGGQKPKFSYTGHLKHFLCISGAVFLIGIIFACVWGVKLDINFKGGSRYTFSYSGDLSAKAAEKALEDALGVSLEVSESHDYSGNAAKLVVSVTGDAIRDFESLTESEASAAASGASSDTASGAVSSAAASGSVSSAAASSAAASSGAVSSGSASSGTASAGAEETGTTEIGGAGGVLLDALRTAFPDHNVVFGDSNTVSPTMAAKFFAKCLCALLIASVLLLVYIAIRFRNIGGFSAGVMSLVALVHDLIVAFIACIVFRLEIDMNFVAVVLTILGYSLNDTIVVYDRIRENRRLYPQKSLREITDDSLLQVTNRTITTSVATFIAVAAILIVAELNGLTTLRTFTIPMALGIISGSYSSLCLAAPLWVKWNEWKAGRPKKPKKQKKSK